MVSFKRIFKEIKGEHLSGLINIFFAEAIHGGMGPYSLWIYLSIEKGMNKYCQGLKSHF